MLELISIEQHTQDQMYVLNRRCSRKTDNTLLQRRYIPDTKIYSCRSSKTQVQCGYTDRKITETFANWKRLKRRWLAIYESAMSSYLPNVHSDRGSLRKLVLCTTGQLALLNKTSALDRAEQYMHFQKRNYNIISLSKHFASLRCHLLRQHREGTILSDRNVWVWPCSSHSRIKVWQALDLYLRDYRSTTKNLKLWLLLWLYLCEFTSWATKLNPFLFFDGVAVRLLQCLRWQDVFVPPY